jgi:hypothetical protein
VNFTTVRRKEPVLGFGEGRVEKNKSASKFDKKRISVIFQLARIPESDRETLWAIRGWKVAFTT